jgi:hypothetical protein
MEKYNIIKLENLKYDYLIIANTCENPVNIFLADDVTIDIVGGNIVFDLTLINGIKPNRYVGAFMKDSKIDILSIKPLVDVDAEIKKLSREYFIKNDFLIRNSVLPSGLKYVILNS